MENATGKFSAFYEKELSKVAHTNNNPIFCAKDSVQSRFGQKTEDFKHLLTSFGPGVQETTLFDAFEKLITKKLKMPGLVTKEKCLINQSIIGKRFMKYIASQIEEMGVKNFRQIIKMLRDTSSGMYHLMIEYAEVKVRISCSTLSGFQGDRILGNATAFLYERHRQGFQDNLIGPLVHNLHPETLKEAGLRKILVNQRYYLQSVAEAIEVIAAIKNYNDKLARNDDVQYNTIIRLNNDLIHPGQTVVRACYYLRKLLTADNLQADLIEAAAAEAGNAHVAQDDAFQLLVLDINEA